MCIYYKFSDSVCTNISSYYGYHTIKRRFASELRAKLSSFTSCNKFILDGLKWCAFRIIWILHQQKTYKFSNLFTLRNIWILHRQIPYKVSNWQLFSAESRYICPKIVTFNFSCYRVCFFQEFWLEVDQRYWSSSRMSFAPILFSLLFSDIHSCLTVTHF